MTLRTVLHLGESVSRDAVDDAIAAAGLSLINVLPAGPVYPRQIIAARADGGASAIFVHDARIGAHFAVLEGELAGDAAEAIARVIPPVEPIGPAAAAVAELSRGGS